MNIGDEVAVFGKIGTVIQIGKRCAAVQVSSGQIVVPFLHEVTTIPNQSGKSFADSRSMWAIDGVDHYWQTGAGRSIFGNAYAFKDQLVCKSGDVYYVPPIDKITNHLI